MFIRSEKVVSTSSYNDIVDIRITTPRYTLITKYLVIYQNDVICMNDTFYSRKTSPLP